MKKGNLSKFLRRDKSIEPQLCLQWRSVGDGEPGVFQWIGRHILQSLPRTRREGISVFDRVGFVRSRRETNFHRSTFRNPNGLETGHHRTGRIPWSRRRRCPCETIGGFLDQKLRLHRVRIGPRQHRLASQSHANRYRNRRWCSSERRSPIRKEPNQSPLHPPWLPRTNTLRSSSM